MEEKTQRRLAAIVSADVVGYSRLMGVDETGTLAALDAHRTELIEPKIAEYDGRIVKTMGDGLLLEFPSVVNATQCSIDVQRGMAERNRGIDEDKQIDFRFGVNVGDIIVDGDDIHGDGVNVAARLEGLAEAGGICLSLAARDQIRDKLHIELEDLGNLEVKNIARPVRVFRVILEGEQAKPILNQKHTSPYLRWLIVAGVVLVIIGGAGAWWWNQPSFAPADPTKFAHKLPDKPSVAVLPFDNMSGDLAQEPFVDGMTDDLITDLSKVSGLFVIARNSTFVYKNKPVEIRQVAEALGVRYVVEGSVRRAGGTIRVNAQLIDAATGGHVWAERYDGEAGDIFRVQDDFVRKIVDALRINLAPQESQRIGRGQTNQIAAREAFQKGWELYLRFNAEDNAVAIKHLHHAIELDPTYGRANAVLSFAYLRSTFLSWGAPLGISNREAFETAQFYRRQAEEFPPALLHASLALQHLIDNELVDALDEVTLAISLDPNEPEAHIIMAWVLITDGKPDEALESIETAIRLNPIQPNHYVWTKGAAYFAKEDFEGATNDISKRLEREPQARELAPLLASAYAILGQREKARAALLLWKPLKSQQQLRRIPDSFVLRFFRSYEYRVVRDSLHDGLYIASLPLEITVPSLVNRLQGDVLAERLIALNTLGRFGPMAKAATPALISALNDKDKEVRRRAIQALAKIGPAAKDAVPALRTFREDDLMEYYANEAIKSIIGE